MDEAMSSSMLAIGLEKEVLTFFSNIASCSCYRMCECLTCLDILGQGWPMDKALKHKFKFGDLAYGLELGFTKWWDRSISMVGCLQDLCIWA